MTVTVFGATGLVGKYLVKQALLKGFNVRAFARNILAADYPDNEKLKLMPGSAFDEGQVLKAVSNSDVVLSALGGLMDGVDKTRSLGMKTIVSQMQKAGVKRIIAVGGVGILDSGAGNEKIMDTKQFPREFLPVSNEHLKALEYLQNSGLTWTMVCPPMIADADVTGEYLVQADTVPVSKKGNINAGDLSLFMLSEAVNARFPEKRVGIIGK